MSEEQLTTIIGAMDNASIKDLCEVSERLMIMREEMPQLKEAAETALNLIRDNLKSREGEAVATVLNMCGVNTLILTGKKIDLSKY